MPVYSGLTRAASTNELSAEKPTTSTRSYVWMCALCEVRSVSLSHTWFGLRDLNLRRRDTDVQEKYFIVFGRTGDVYWY